MFKKNIRKRKVYLQKELRKSLFQFFRLMKASFLIALAPVMVFAIYVIYGKLSLADMVYATVLSFIIALLFIYPYLADLSSLTRYVEQLAKDKKAKPPSLSFLSNIERLSAEVHKLNTSWEKKRLQLEAMVVESKILFDILPDLLIMLDEDLRIVRTNSSAANLFRKSLQHKKLEEVIADPLLLSFVKWVMHDRKGKSLEVRLPAPIDRHYLAHIERFPIHSPAGIAIILILHDVTESKHTEQMFADFVANASHEIRTPLTSLIGFIETLKGVAKDDPEAQEMFLNVMADQADRMSRLVSDLLSLSKIEMNANMLPTDRVQLSTLVASVIKQTAWHAEQRNMRIELEAEENLPFIIGDANQLIQLVTNLIENAIKYGYENTLIKVILKVVTSLPKEVEHMRGVKRAMAFIVQDQGEGIEKEHIPRLTERFYRVDSARSRKSKIGGTGLGLAIVKQIVKRHQGDMVIESTVGVGSTFSVYFPCEDHA